MALKATVYKADLQISDIDRGYYAGHLPDEAVVDLGALAARNMALQCIVQDGQLVLSDARTSLAIEPEALQRAAG